LFGAGGGEALAAHIDAPLLGKIPIEPAVAAGGDAGEPVALSGDGPAATAFRDIATAIATELAPTRSVDDIDMAGCTARLFETVDAAFAELDG
jgi:ATP-binding protein involved in chromosome partitioning